MVDELIRRSDVIDAIYDRNKALLCHEQYRRKRGDIDLLGVIGNINAIPIVDAEPIKHGRWINDKGLYKCSICNNFTITGWANCIPIEQMNKTMKYCNNCGAKMDLDEVEE